MSRTPCSVPHCGRTRQGDPGALWICGDHWKLVARDRRIALRRRLRAWERDRSETNSVKTSIAFHVCLRHAIETAAGIR